MIKKLDSLSYNLDITKKLRVDLSSYLPEEGSPEWFSQLAKLTLRTYGVSSLLGPSGINANISDNQRSRIQLDSMAVYLAGLADRTRMSGQKIAVGCPPIARHLPLMLATSAVCANTLDNYINQKKLPHHGVLVISYDLDVRSKYCDLFIQSTQIDEAYPGSRLRPSGDLVALSRIESRKKHEGVCFYLPFGTPPNHIRLDPGLVILDLRHPRATKKAIEILKWVNEFDKKVGILGIYWIGDIETQKQLIEMGYIDLPIDQSAIATSLTKTKTKELQKNNVIVDWETSTAPSYLSRKHELIHVKNADDIETILSDIGKMLNTKSGLSNPDLNRSRWIFAILTTLPVPLIWYEMAARSLGRFTLHRLISWLGKGNINSDLAPLIQSIRMQFEKLYEILNKSNPRKEALLDIFDKLIRENEEDSSKILLLTRDKTIQRAVQTWLEMEVFPKKDTLVNLDVKACSEYIPDNNYKYKESIIIGSFPRRQRWLANANLGQVVNFLLYRHEKNIIEQQLLGVYGESARNYRRKKREEAIQSLSQIKNNNQDYQDSPIPPLELTGQENFALQKPNTASDKPIVLNGLDKLAEAWAEKQRILAEENLKEQETQWEEDMFSDDSPDDLVLNDDQSVNYWGVSETDCIKVEVESSIRGTGIIWLYVDDIIECIRPTSSEDIIRITPRSLKLHDIMIRFEEGTRGSLFDRIIELAEGQPEMQYLGSFRHAWRSAVQRMIALFSDNRGIDFVRMLKALQDNGAKIQSETALRFWTRDQVIGPEARSSIIAVGKVSGSRVLVNEYNQFDQAFRTIRSIHQVLGRQLSSAIKKTFSTFIEGDMKETDIKLDNRLGLPLDELMECIEYLEVKAIFNNPEKLTTNLVNRFSSST